MSYGVRRGYASVTVKIMGLKRANASVTLCTLVLGETMPPSLHLPLEINSCYDVPLTQWIAVVSLLYDTLYLYHCIDYCDLVVSCWAMPLSLC